MRWGRARGLVLFACAACVTTKTGGAGLYTYPPGINGITHLVYYEVDGRTAQEIAADIFSNRPGHPAGGVIVGETRTPLAVTWTTQIKGSTCAAMSVRVAMTSEITLPRWTPPPDTEPGLAAEWQKFLDKIERHEGGHKDISARAAREIIDRAQHMDVACAALAGAIYRIRDEVILQSNAHQTAFDDSTQNDVANRLTFPSREYAMAHPRFVAPAGTSVRAATSGEATPPRPVASHIARLEIQGAPFTFRVGDTLSIAYIRVIALDSTGAAIGRVLMFDTTIPEEGFTAAGYRHYLAVTPGTYTMTVRLPPAARARSDSTLAAQAQIVIKP